MCLPVSARMAAIVGACVACLLAVASADAAVTPGWECIPQTAGQGVVSGGTGSAPSCDPATTPVLAPTYVSTGVGGKPTVQFSAVNVQILNGAGSTASTNGEGNLVLGYDESPGSQTGSHDLVLGQSQTFTGYGELIAGLANTVSGAYAAALGEHNRASGSYSVAAGNANQAGAAAASALGGYANLVRSAYSAIIGGCDNVAGTGTLPALPASCSDSAGHAGDFAAIAGGGANQVTGITSSASGGLKNAASGSGASVSGGQGNNASASYAAIAGGLDNAVTDSWGAILGGCSNTTGDGTNPNYTGTCSGETVSSANAISGGQDNSVSKASNSVIAGGYNNNVGASFGSISGGYQNFVNDKYGSILGGCSNETGAATPTPCSAPFISPEAESVSGGSGNDAFAIAASILGGQGEVLTGDNWSKAGTQSFGP